MSFISKFRQELSRVFDDDLHTKQWHNYVDYAIIGLIILAFAVMNYINLTVAQAGRRAKEMATRRLLGSLKRDIMVRMVLESTALCAFSSTM